MNNIKVTEIEFRLSLLPRTENRFVPFFSHDICAEDLPEEINKNIWEELKRGRDVIPVKMTINVNITGMNIADDIADEVMEVARRALKSVVYLNEADRGTINSGLLTGDEPFVLDVKANPLSVIEAITSGCSYNVKVIGFLIRAN